MENPMEMDGVLQMAWTWWLGKFKWCLSYKIQANPSWNHCFNDGHSTERNWAIGTFSSNTHMYIYIYILYIYIYTYQNVNSRRQAGHFHELCWNALKWSRIMELHIMFVLFWTEVFKSCLLAMFGASHVFSFLQSRLHVTQGLIIFQL